MGELNDPRRRDGMNRSAEQLRRIADALGLPLATFFDGDTNVAGDGQIGELVRLWAVLNHDADRQKVLAFMRDLRKYPSEI